MSYVSIVQEKTPETLDLSLTNPLMLVGLFIGAMLAFVFSAYTMSAVQTAAQSIVLEVRRQFREIAGIMEYKADPDYASCVALCTKGALREMVAPALLAIIVPILTGLLLGPEGVVGLLGGQFTVVIAIIAAVAGAFVILWNRSEKFRNSVMGIWQRVQPLIQAFGNLVSLIATSLAPVLANLGTVVLGGLEAAFVAIAPYIENVITILTNLIEFITNVFSGNWSAAWQNVVNIFGSVFGMIVNLAKVPINAVISAINWVISKINSISVTIPDWVPGVGGTTLGFNIPTIPALAAGGVATAPTLAMIGEGGEPEAVMPLSKLAELLDEWTKPKPQGGGGGQEDAGGDHIVWSPVFNFYGNTTKEEAVAAARMSFAKFKKMYKQMKAEERRKSFSPA